MKLTFRIAQHSDLERMTEIYNQAIQRRNSTSHTETFQPEERISWLLEHEKEPYPLFVCLVDGEVMGYTYFTPYRVGRKALAHVAEVSYYLDFSCHGKGIGTAMLEFMKEEAKKRDFSTLIAVLFSTNIASARILEKCGFSLWGTLPDVVRLEDRIISHLYYGIHME